MPPSWVIEPKDIRAKAGNDLTLECFADGLPKPTIKWISSEGLNCFLSNMFSRFSLEFIFRKYY